MSTTDTVQKITSYLAVLPGDQVKAAMLAWTTNADISIAALEQALAKEKETIAIADTLYESEDFETEFPSMTESEMIEESLHSLAEYQRTGESITQENMEAWAKTLTDEST